MKFPLPFSLIIPAFLLSFAIPSLFTACKPARTVPVVYTISGDISHKNMFPVKDTVIIHDDTTVKSFADQIGTYSRKSGCGVYLQKEEDNTRIKFVFPLMGLFEDIPEYNEEHWQSCFIKCNPIKSKSIPPPWENDPKQIPTDINPPSNKDNPEFVGTGIIHYKRYVCVPLLMEKGNMYLDDEKIDPQTLKEMFPDYKICVQFSFKDKNDCVARYWPLMKQVAMLAQARFSIGSPR